MISHSGKTAMRVAPQIITALLLFLAGLLCGFGLDALRHLNLSIGRPLYYESWYQS